MIISKTVLNSSVCGTKWRPLNAVLSRTVSGGWGVTQISSMKVQNVGNARWKHYSGWDPSRRLFNLLIDSMCLYVVELRFRENHYYVF